MTSGASAGLAIGCRALLSPGDECITLTPYFSEYRTYTEAAGGVMCEVPSEPETFQLDYEAFAAAVNGKTWLVILNSPNNPSGVVLGEESIKKIAALLTERSAEYGHPIYILADEPYRDLVYDGDAVPYIPNFYPRHDLLLFVQQIALAARRARRLSRRAAGEQGPRHTASRRVRRGPDAGVCLCAGAFPARVRRVPRPDGRAARV